MVCSVVRRPGAVLIDPARRKAELAAMPPAVRTCYCGPPPGSAEPPDRLLTPVVTIPASARYGGGSTVTEPFAFFIMERTAAAWAADDKAGLAVVADLLSRWAAAGAITRIEGDPANGAYAAGRSILPLIVNYALIRPGLAVIERQLLDRWIGDAVGTLPVVAGAGTGRNNHRLLRDSIHMAYGALVGDAAAFALGMTGFERGLGEARADGGLPLELRRGFRAIFYQRHAISSLVVMAEVAAVQGEDLYGLAVRGVSLHRVIGFLLDAIDDPSIVWPDAAADRAVPPGYDFRRQDLGFLDRRGHGRHYMAWVEPYIARFPDHANAERLRRFFAANRFVRPMIDDFAGGNTTCLCARNEVG